MSWLGYYAASSVLLYALILAPTALDKARHDAAMSQGKAMVIAMQISHHKEFTR